MAKDINLNSTEWCELVFEGKNKSYGAYAMRQTSSKRHLLAFAFVIVFTVLISLLPFIIKAMNPEKPELLGSIDGPVVLSDLAQPEEVETESIHELPPPPPMVKAQKFTPPVITDDEDVREEDVLKSQKELMESRGIISTITFESDLTEGVDPGEVLREQREITGKKEKETPPMEYAEVMPQFPGGNNELMNYLSKNLRYPAMAADIGIQGRVILKFVVGKDGSISDIQIVKGVDPALDKEASKVVQGMPKWIPGSQNGHPVAVYFTLPVLFKLQNS